MTAAWTVGMDPMRLTSSLWPFVVPSGLRVTAMTEIPAVTSARSQVEVKEDWTFEFTGVRAPVRRPFVDHSEVHSMARSVVCV